MLRKLVQSAVMVSGVVGLLVAEAAPRLRL
jgi:hypothetical protein